MNRPTHAGLRHLALNVRELEAMKRFYVDLLGFAVEWQPDADNIYLSSGIDNLALHRSEAADAALSDFGAGSPLDHLGLIVKMAKPLPGDDPLFHRGRVHVRDVFLDHAAGAETRRHGPNRFLDRREPAARDIRAVALVERRHDFLLEQPV